MNTKRVIIATIGIGAFMLSMVPAFSAEPNRRIVVFKDDLLGASERRELIGFLGGEVVRDLPSVNGYAAALPRSAEEALRYHPAVLRVENDAVVRAFETDQNFLEAFFDRIFEPFRVSILRLQGGKPQPSQTVSWGIAAVGADGAWSVSQGEGIRVGILDTGADLKHLDLKVNVVGNYNAINPAKQANDDNGHGTHVAGIVAALRNEIGTVGVAPKASLYPIKVLNASGSGYVSDVIAGIEWAVSKNLQIANMSFGASEDVLSLREAIQKARAAGMVLVAAAGNDYATVSYPARYPEVIAVSAIDREEAIAKFSGRGEEIDLAAPGVEIYSTYRNGGYATLSGTSMAAPFVSGVAAIALTQPVGAYDADGDGRWDPAELERKIFDTAKDIGVTGLDPLFGHGIPYAPRVIQN